MSELVGRKIWKVKVIITKAIEATRSWVTQPASNEEQGSLPNLSRLAAAGTFHNHMNLLMAMNSRSSSPTDATTPKTMPGSCLALETLVLIRSSRSKRTQNDTAVQKYWKSWSDRIKTLKPKHSATVHSEVAKTGGHKEIKTIVNLNAHRTANQVDVEAKY